MEAEGRKVVAGTKEVEGTRAVGESQKLDAIPVSGGIRALGEIRVLDVIQELDATRELDVIETQEPAKIGALMISYGRSDFRTTAAITMDAAPILRPPITATDAQTAAAKTKMKGGSREARREKGGPRLRDSTMSP